MSMMPTMTIGGSGGVQNEDSIFNLGGVFDRLGSTALDAFDKVAPVWLNEQLGLDERQPVAVAPTFKADPANQPTDNLTTSTASNTDRGFVVRQETLVLIGGGLLVVGALVFLND